MKALTISQPYASLIASGEKWVENRRWATDTRGPLAIHAGKGTQYLDRKQLEQYPTGQIIAVCRLVACVSLNVVKYGDLRKEITPGITAEMLLQHEHTEGPYCWVLADIRQLNKGIVCRGAQGLWEIDLESLELAES